PDTKEVMNTVVSSASSLAVGSLMGLIRELAASQLPAEWKGEATKLIVQVTTQLGGKPTSAWEKAPETPSQPTQHEQGVQSQPNGSQSFSEETRQEDAPFDTQQQTDNGGSREKRGRIQTSRKP